MSSSCPFPLGCSDQFDNSSSNESANVSAVRLWCVSRNPLKRSSPNSWSDELLVSSIPSV